MNLRSSIEDLFFDYAAVLDQGALERWPDFFTEDAFYEIIARENAERALPLSLMRCEGRGMILDRAIALKEVIFYAPRTYRHLIGNVRPRAIDETNIEVVANFVVYQSLVETRTELLVAGEYRDRVVLGPGGMRFAEKRCIYDTTMLPNTVVYPL